MRPIVSSHATCDVLIEAEAVFASFYGLIVRQVWVRSSKTMSPRRSNSRSQPVIGHQPQRRWKTACVADDVVEVLHRRVGAGVVLVIGPCAADPRQRRPGGWRLAGRSRCPRRRSRCTARRTRRARTIVARGPRRTRTRKGCDHHLAGRRLGRHGPGRVRAPQAGQGRPAGSRPGAAAAGRRRGHTARSGFPRSRRADGSAAPAWHLARSRHRGRSAGPRRRSGRAGRRCSGRGPAEAGRAGTAAPRHPGRGSRVRARPGRTDRSSSPRCAHRAGTSRRAVPVVAGRRCACRPATSVMTALRTGCPVLDGVAPTDLDDLRRVSCPGPRRPGVSSARRPAQARRAAQMASSRPAATGRR